MHEEEMIPKLLLPAVYNLGKGAVVRPLRLSARSASAGHTDGTFAGLRS